jgi:ArsR family transcriptional regulator
MKNIAALFKSLEDETRLRIIALLLSSGELCVCDLITVLQLPQSTVSRHLATLKNGGWLRDRRAGVWIYYSIAPDLTPIHRTIIGALRDLFEHDETAGSDRERLAQSGSKNCCA